MNKLIIIILLPLLLISCKNEYIEQQLAEAESQLTENPDSALALLDAITLKEIKDREQRAHYALLMTQARDKNYVIETDDSLINIACDYYETVKNYKNASFAYFYKGIIAVNKNDPTTAIGLLLKAKDLSDNIMDYFLTAKINEAIADLYYNSFNYEESLKYRKIASKCYNECGKKQYALYADVDIARTYDALGKYEIAVNKLDSILSTNECKDSLLLSMIYDSYIRPLNSLDKNKEALKMLKLSENYLLQNKSDFRTYPIIASVLLHNNMIDSALMYIKIAEKDKINWRKTPQYHFFKKDYAKYCGNREDYLNEIDSIYLIRNKITSNLYKNNILLAERDYYSEKSIHEAVKAERIKNMLWALVIVGFISVIGIFVYFGYKRNQQKHILENKILEVNALKYEMLKHKETLNKLNDKLCESQNSLIDSKQEISEKNARIIECQNLIEQLFNKNFEGFDNICNEYYEKRDSDKAIKTLINSLEQEISKVNSEIFVGELKNIIDIYWNNYITEIQNSLTDISDKDIKLIIFYLAGFSTRTIALFLDIKPGNFYNRKKRLKDRIAQSDIKNKEKILELLNK